MSAPAIPRSGLLAVASPILDFLTVGGLSILLFVPLLIAGPDDLGSIVGLGLVVWAQLLANYSHFLASYRIVYRDRQMILKHKWASIGVPLILLAGVAIALAEAAGGGRFMVTVFFAVASGYLAWHYTGQTWGMMVAFAHLDGTRFDRTEYWLIRGGLRILLVWHLAWFLKTTLAEPGIMLGVYQVASAATLLAAASGLLGLGRMWKRTGRVPPARAVVAWVAIFVWYAVIARWGIPGLFLVQFAHALQYLEFPARVELNRAVREQSPNPLGHTLAWGAGLVALALLVVVVLFRLLVPGEAVVTTARALGAPQDLVLPALISNFIGIHHFFTDGVIWKLREPEVQQDLFAHARPVAATVPVPPMWWEREWWKQAWDRLM